MAYFTTDTKKDLFDKAVELFSINGYENVSMNNIANGIGLQAASIYNHFKSKTEILETIYDYYEKNIYNNRPTNEKLDPVLESGSASQIIHTLAWNFYGLPEDEHRRMTMITKIIYARFLIDQRANSIFRRFLLTGNAEYTSYAFNKLTTIGRLPADFDVTGHAEMLLYVSLMTGIDGISNNYAGGIVDSKQYLKDLFSSILSHEIDKSVLGQNSNKE